MAGMGGEKTFGFHRLFVRSYYFYFLRWMVNVYAGIGQHSFFLIWAIVTGLLTGCAVVLIRLTAGRLESFFLNAHANLSGSWWMLPVFLMPFAGMATSLGIKRLFNRSNSTADMTLLIRAIRNHNPNRIKLETLSHIIASPVCIGLGASAGLTTPSVLTGASIGANVGRFLQLRPDRLIKLMICGTSAGIAAIFGSPVAGILFAVEVLIPRMNVATLIPVLLSAAGATVVSQILLDYTPFFGMLCKDWKISSLPIYLLLGICSAGIGIYMIRINEFLNGFFVRRYPEEWMRLLWGGMILSCMIFLFPALSGEGLVFIRELNLDHGLGNADANFLFMGFCACMVMMKIVSTSLTLSCGGSGGFFAPTLFTGAFFGFLTGNLFRLFGWHELFDSNFIALGMCGVFASAFRAPLTGIFLVVEMSGSYVLMIPLMIVGATSYFVTTFFESHSVYTRDPAAHLTDDSLGRRVPSGSVRQYLNRAFHPVPYGKELDSSLLLKTHADMLFPVLDENGILFGILKRPDLEKCAGTTDIPGKIMLPPLGVVRETEPLSTAIAAMKIFNLESLPVIDRRNRFKGFFVLKSDLSKKDNL